VDGLFAPKERSLPWQQGSLTCGFALQFDVLKTFMAKGGSLLFLVGEGGESRYETNVNFLFEQYGVMVNTGALRVVVGGLFL
jgi:hypothetical protein